MTLGNRALVGGEAGPALRLTPSGAILSGSAPIGSVSADETGTIWSTAQYPDGPGPAFVYTNLTASVTVPLPAPQRALDTRIASGRTNIIGPSSNLDSSGRLIGGRAIHIDLGTYVSFGYGVLGNLGIVTPTSGGFATIYPYAQPLPLASSINYNTGANISNFYTVFLGFDPNGGEPTDAVTIYSQKTVHVILDVTGFIVGSVDQVLVGLGANGATVNGAAKSAGAVLAERQKRAMQEIRKRRAAK